MRPHVKISDVKAGTRLKVDYAFSCVDPEQVVIVCEERHDLFFQCLGGRHYLDGQLTDDGLHYLGFTLAVTN